VGKYKHFYREKFLFFSAVISNSRRECERQPMLHEMLHKIFINGDVAIDKWDKILFNNTKRARFQTFKDVKSSKKVRGLRGAIRACWTRHDSGHMSAGT
ncbi:MAG: hypothetical protein LIO80_00500, partial [Lachnospiraceae bacterium]|nr:hypothetical protein [Clostridiales bacterium]MCC8080491.1 hypothetical protein [Lachnospiraceae bacterium]